MNISQRTAILIDGNNIGLSVHQMINNDDSYMPNWDTIVPNLVNGRELVKLMYFREGNNISPKLQERMDKIGYGMCIPCGKSADVQLTIQAVQLADKVDTIILMSGDVDYVPLVHFLKSRGIRVEICGVRVSMSNELRVNADSVKYITPDDCWKFSKNQHNDGIV